MASWKTPSDAAFCCSLLSLSDASALKSTSTPKPARVLFPSVDADSECPANLIVPDRPHRHLGHRDAHHLRPAHVIVGDLRHRRVRDDAVHAPDNVAALDHAHAHVHVVGDVDPLAQLVAEHVDGAVFDHHAAEPHVDPVELRARNGDAVEHRVAVALDRDPVLATDDRDVADRDAVRPHDDASPDDRACVADQHFAPPDHERALVDAG